LRGFQVRCDHLLNSWISQAPFSLVQMNERMAAGIERLLGIRLTAVGPDFICGDMPVDERTQQPFGLLHGGASIVLAETLGSWGSFLLTCDEPSARVAGIEVSGSHLRAVRSGRVRAIARPLRLGNSLHFWRIDILDPEDRVSCSAKLTVKVGSRGDAAGKA
jgi:1,4-dihydroxy-2-naphthoyl-CoA hydrolase